MRVVQRYRRGIVVGFLCGTLGIFLLSLLSLVSPVVETLAVPVLLPGRVLASTFSGSSASTGMVLVLYLCTGIFYAIVGAIIQAIVRMLRSA